MNEPTRRHPHLVVSATLSALAACSTQEIPGGLVTHQQQSSPTQAALLIQTCPDPDDVPYITTMTNGPNDGIAYHVFIDGRLLVYEDVDLQPTTTIGDVAKAGDIASGPHHFQVADARGGPPLFEGDAVMPAGTLTRLYLYGQSDAPQGLFVTYPLAPAAGSMHVNLTNLAIDGHAIEAVSCDDLTHCTPVSSPLAVGETFDASFPLTGFEDYNFSRSASGGGIGFREVPSAALPTPPIMAMFRDAGTPDVGAAVNFAHVVMLMNADGTSTLGRN
jgi:hypothetical protein